MSNFVEYNDKIAYHPGFYIKEIVEDSGLTQDDFAKKLGTTPKNLCKLIRGEQSLSVEMAAKMARMLGTSVDFWLNLQNAYDVKIAEYYLNEDLKKEREVYELIDYTYFIENCGLPKLPRKKDEQIKCVREFLSVSSLTVLEKRDLAVSFRSDSRDLSRSNIVNANVMVQMAIKKTLDTETPPFNKEKLKKVVPFLLAQTKNHGAFLPVITDSLKEVGVVLVVLPNLKNSGINGATKRVDKRMMLMVNDRRHYEDTFWFTLFHEVGHIMNGNLGVSFENDKEDAADLYARNQLIPKEEYETFLSDQKSFNKRSIIGFAQSINRDPGIVLGRLMKDGKVKYTDKELSEKLRHKFIYMEAY